jgi:hypothetical protein
MLAGSSESWVQGCQLSVALSADPGSSGDEVRSFEQNRVAGKPTSPDCRSWLASEGVVTANIDAG